MGSRSLPTRNVDTLATFPWTFPTLIFDHQISDQCSRFKLVVCRVNPFSISCPRNIADVPSGVFATTTFSRDATIATFTDLPSFSSDNLMSQLELGRHILEFVNHPKLGRHKTLGSESLRKIIWLDISKTVLIFLNSSNYSQSGGMLKKKDSVVPSNAYLEFDDEAMSRGLTVVRLKAKKVVVAGAQLLLDY
jgi:hypothetical protein